MNKRIADILYFFGVAFVGAAVVVAVAQASPKHHTYTTGYLPWMRTAAEDFSRYSFLGLAVVGLFAGFIRPQKWALWGFATMVLFPLWAIVEITLDPTSHNLWPIEFVCYGVESLAAVAGARLGSLLAKQRG